MNENTPQTCSRCGASLPADAPEGLCPRCIGAFPFATDTACPGGPASAPAPPAVEDIAPHFPQLEVLECLGRGGMGVVYKARQRSLDRTVALKILAPEREKDPEFAARFVREAQALARLDHPHIVTVHDFGQADGFFYLLMEFVDGVNLRQAMRAGRFTPRQALAVVPQICEALQFAHDHGIIHRDIKPENILLDREGRVKIADFGVAKILGPEASAATEDDAAPSDLTQAQGIVGTPRYMAPEQVAHPLDVDHRADIYSLGVVFYEMLTGELPASRIEPPSRKVVVDVRLDEVVLRALEKEPGRRYQKAGEVGTLVETIASTQAGPLPGGPRNSGMVRLIEILFDSKFISPAAVRLINISALGFLGFLGNLRHLSPDLRWCSSFSGFFGFFGFIGVAFLVETSARRTKTGAPPATGRHWRLWSPSQPPMVREICAHMTEGEKRDAVWRGLLFGLWNAATFFGPFFLIWFSSLPGPLNWMYGGIVLIVGLSFYPHWRKMQREFLCSTAWAKQQEIKPEQLEGFCLGGRKWIPEKEIWSVVIAVAIAMVVRAFVLEPFIMGSNAVSPEVPRGSFVLAYKLARSFAPGDIIVYRGIGGPCLGRVIQPGPEKGCLTISRGHGPPVRLQVGQTRGKVVFNTRPDSEPQARPEGSAPAPGPQGSPSITRVTVASDRAVVEGRAAPDSLLVFQVGEGSSSSGFLNDLPFKATFEPVDWGRGFSCRIEDVIGNALLTLGNSRIGPMTYERGRLVLRPGIPSPEPDDSYIIGEFRTETAGSFPVSVRLESPAAKPGI